MSIESRPKMYFPSMTESEVIAYAETHYSTDLETALLELVKSALDEAADNTSELDDYIWELTDAGRDLTNAVSAFAVSVEDDVDAETLLTAVEEYERRVSNAKQP